MNEEIEQTEPSIQLSKELKEGTKKVHREAENIQFVKEFAKGRIERQWYKELLADLYFVYRALEEESEKHKDYDMFKAVHFPKELGRLQSLEEDLEFYFGEEWKEQISMSDATKAYVNRIHEAADEDPTLLIAHHYTMYRSRLDELNIDKVKSDEIVKEANYAFKLNIYLFQEIDALAGFAEQEPKKKKLTAEEIYSSADTRKDYTGVCPFATMATKPAQVNTEAIPHGEGRSIDPVLLAIIIVVAAVLMRLIYTKMA